MENEKSIGKIADIYRGFLVNLMDERSPADQKMPLLNLSVKRAAASVISLSREKLCL